MARDLSKKQMAVKILGRFAVMALTMSPASTLAQYHPSGLMERVQRMEIEQRAILDHLKLITKTPTLRPTATPTLTRTATPTMTPTRTMSEQLRRWEAENFNQCWHWPGDFRPVFRNGSQLTFTYNDKENAEWVRVGQRALLIEPRRADEEVALVTFKYGVPDWLLLRLNGRLIRTTDSRTPPREVVALSREEWDSRGFPRVPDWDDVGPTAETRNGDLFRLADEPRCHTPTPLPSPTSPVWCLGPSCP